MLLSGKSGYRKEVIVICGITGWKCFGDARPEPDVVQDLLLGVEHRGHDATGVGWLEGPTLRVLKKAITATKFVRKAKFKELMESPPAVCIMHTRAKTQGHESNNKNNHPVFNKVGMGLIHNGMIRNYDHLSKGLDMDGQVDSEIILRLIEKKWWSDIKNLNDLLGTFAIAVINADKPDELILARSGSPLAVGLDSANKILYWSSEKSAIDMALASFKFGFIVKAPVHTYHLEDNLAFLVDAMGVATTVDVKASGTMGFDTTRSFSKPFPTTTIESGHSSAAKLLCEGCQHSVYKLYDYEEETDGEEGTNDVVSYTWRVCHSCRDALAGETYCTKCQKTTKQRSDNTCAECNTPSDRWLAQRMSET